jgi:hypothetical protein
VVEKTPVTSKSLRLVCATLMVLAAAVTPSLGAIMYTTIDHPLAGPGGTTPYSIDGDRIVGSYLDGSGATHGFLYDGTTWATLDDPLAAAPRGTTAYGVSGPTICGTYVTATGQTLGFLNDGANWTTLEHPPVGLGRVDTFARGISGGTVVGYYIQSLAAHGFSYRDGIFTDFDIPATSGTFPHDVDGTRIIGTVDDALGTHGFFIDQGVPVLFDHPLGVLLGTFGNGVSGPNIVGNFLSLTDGASHGFIFGTSGYTTLDVPGATDTTANGIDGDRIVGSYVDAAGATHGFIAVVPEPARAAALTALLGATTLRRRRTEDTRR